MGTFVLLKFYKRLSAQGSEKTWIVAIQYWTIEYYLARSNLIGLTSSIVIIHRHHPSSSSIVIIHHHHPSPSSIAIIHRHHPSSLPIVHLTSYFVHVPSSSSIVIAIAHLTSYFVHVPSFMFYPHRPSSSSIVIVHRHRPWFISDHNSFTFHR